MLLTRENLELATAYKIAKNNYFAEREAKFKKNFAYMAGINGTKESEIVIDYMLEFEADLLCTLFENMIFANANTLAEKQNEALKCYSDSIIKVFSEGVVKYDDSL